MGKKRKRGKRSGGGTLTSGGRLVIDRAGRSGHFQANNYSEVYRDGKVFVYTSWDDKAEEQGQPMDFEEWLASHRH